MSEKPIQPETFDLLFDKVMKHERVSMKLEDVHLADYNPRIELKPGDTQYEALKRSILRWGMVEPPVWNKRTQTLVAGHQRLNVAKDLGIKELEFVVVDLDLDDEMALNIALNQIGSVFDPPKLQDVLGKLKDMNPDMLNLTGFSQAELDDLLDQIIAPEDIDEEFKEFDADIETEYKCPSCGYCWSGKPKPE